MTHPFPQTKQILDEFRKEFQQAKITFAREGGKTFGKPLGGNWHAAIKPYSFTKKGKKS